jgi:periplasmic protein TonB
VRPVKQEQKPPPDNVAHVEPQDQRPPSAPAAPAAASPDEMARFEGQVRQAVQRAVVYPMAAREAHEIGRTQVAFILRGDRAADPAVAQSSGFPILDRAALAAVRDARYPSPPAALGGRELRFLVWVQFQLGEDD